MNRPHSVPVKEVDFLELKDGTEWVIGKKMRVRTLTDNPKKARAYWEVTGIYEPLDFYQTGYHIELRRKTNGHIELRQIRIFSHNINLVGYPSIDAI